MKILFMGTPDFSVPTLETLMHSEHDVIGVVTQPDQPKGRGKQVHQPPIKKVALANNLQVYQPKKVKEEAFIEEMEKLEIDLAIVVAFGQILPKRFLDLPKYGCINIHASLLPKYRGAGPIQWAIIHGEAITGVTTMFMDVGLDTGDMLLKEEVIIEPEDTGGTLHDKLALLGGPLIIRTIALLQSGTLTRKQQDNHLSSYAPMLIKQLGSIKWHKSAEELERLIRGLNPWPSAFTYFEDKLLKVWSAQVVTIEKKEYAPGTICAIVQAGIIVQCGEHGLLIKEIQLQGKRRMTTNDFLCGHKVEVGTLLQ